MLKHRGFPGRLPGTDFQFTIRRAVNKKGATPIIRRERFRDRRAPDRAADQAFLGALIEHFGAEEFQRGNLDAGRLGWLIGREVVAVGQLDPTDYEQLLRVDMAAAQAAFPQLFEQVAENDDGPDEDWDEDQEERE